MAYARPKDLDGFLPQLSKPDTRFRQQLGTDLLAFLADPENPDDCQDFGLFVDGLIPWLQSSNYKVSSNGIEVLTYLIDRLGPDFRPYLQTVFPNVVDRLGDAKDAVREKSQLLILKLLEKNVVQPQQLLERLQPAFAHKNAKIREEVLRCLVNTLNEHGTHSLTLSKFIPDIVNLLSDPSAAVRDSAHHTLVDLYKHVGERLRLDLQRRNIVPQAKWPALAAKFDEVRARGGTLATPKTAELNSYDELDKVTMATNSTNTIGKRRALPSATSVNSVFSRVGSFRSKSPSGAVDKYSFIKYFEDCPTVQIFSSKEVTEHLKNIQDIISDVNKDWNKRVDALKKIRSLVVAGAVKYEEFHIGLRNLEIPLQGTLKDLRSQVVREACVTIAYLSQTLGNKFDKTAEVVLQHLINLIQNSAKVMATSGLNTVRFIIENTQSSRLIPLLTSNAIRSKSKDIRRACCEFLEYVLTQWQRQPMERHVGVLQEAVKTGIADADPEARLTSRRAFRSFRDHFPDQAEVLLQSLDPVYRKALQGEGMSASSSHNNIASSFKTPRQYGRSAAPSTTGSTENLSSAGGGLQRVPSLPRSYRHRSSVPVLTRENSGRKGFRSNSAIDLQAAQRAKARATYSALARNKIQSGTASLPRPRKSAETVITTASPERVSRRRSRSSQSQPTSRSGSPSSRLAYLYQHRPGATGSVDHHGVHESSPRPRLMSSGIPRSTHGSRDGSRETSPSRNTVSTLGRFRRSGGGERPPLSPASRPVLAQKILQQSREAENALADVFNNSTDHFRSPRRNMRSLDNQSDESETSSICSERSERSYDSFSRHCDSYSWSGSQQRLSSRDLWEPVRDINQIIAMCASTNWQERKDGLLSLQMYMSSEVPLSEGELKHLTEIFTKMFMDSHTKGLGVFLDTLHEVVRNYKHKLHYWIYVLLQRVFLKLGTETLSSIQSKLMATLEIIRSSFPANLLVANVYRFLIDATQTPNAKVKAIVMNFFTSLCNTPEAAQYISLPPASQALQKIITYAQDGKSVETRNAAKTCIVAMWNCNTPQVTMMLAELSKEHQDVASHIVHTHMRRSSAGSEPGSPVVISASSPKPLSPLRDGPDQEEIYRTLRRTTAEIQNYSFEIGLDRDTTSQDSGISQMSLGNDGVTREIQSLEERMEDLTLRPNFNMANRHGGPRSLPYTTVNGVTETDSNGFRSLRESTDSEQLLLTIIDNCFKEVDMSIADKRKLLLQLTSIVSSEDVECVKKHFKKLLKLLVDGLKEDPVTQIAVLQVLRAMFQNPELNDCWTGFVELVLLRVLDAHCVDRREVVKEAEVTAAAMCICPFSTILAILIPLITTSLYPYILGTIKMLTKMIETNPTKITDEHLKQIMPGLIKGADHHESPVRKSSIFCMVAIHKAVGEERLEPHISTLSGSKLKLFRLYVGRSEQTVPTSSVPTSPKNNTSVS